MTCEEPDIQHKRKTTQQRRILIVCAHLHADRSMKRDKDFMQPMAGLHVASVLDRQQYKITLFHESWHGAYPTDAPGDFDLVFLTGLQKDFDRMRQLSYFFRRRGAVVVAGGNICTLFPDFAQEFFDVVCIGGVECVSELMHDFEAGSLKTIYSSPQHNISNYTVDYSLLRENGINCPIHLIEASRGCNFKCDFCVIPAEGATHAAYGIENVAQNINNSVTSSKPLSLQRLFPMIWFIDNNFSMNLSYMRELCAYLKKEPRVRVWGALVTQNILRQHDIIRMMSEAKCRTIFTGIESLNVAFINIHDKKQNLTEPRKLLDDIRFAQ